METIDIFQMARTGSVREGEIELAALPRLAASLAHCEGALSYRCAGTQDEHGRPALRLGITAVLPLRCDRCGRELDLALRAERVFFFVPTEAELAAIPIDDTEQEALLGSTRFDLAALIEDEAILHLPISPRHPACVAQETLLAAALDHDRRHPFAALAGLRERLRQSSPVRLRPTAPATPPQARPSPARRRPRRGST